MSTDLSTKALLRRSRRNLDEMAAAFVADSTELAFPTSPARMNGEKGRTRIMFIENKSGSLTGPGRTGRVSFSKTGRTIYYQGRKFQSLKGAGFKANYFEVESGDRYWISGPRRDGQDFLYGGGGAEIDADCRVEYWTAIRGQPQRVAEGIS